MPDRPLRINLIGLDNGAGLSVDARLLQSLLVDAGFDVTWFKGVRPAKWKMRLGRLAPLRWLMQRFDLNLFLERMHPGWYPFARMNVLIPNPEWFREDLHAYLRGLDVVLCKTQDSQRAFQALGCRTQWIGFTAEDRGDGRLAADTGRLEALHVAGRSEHKGTRAVIDAWARHPEWPRLTVVQRVLDEGTALYAPALPNVRYFSERLSDEALLALQREHAIYILPSEVEGYGQALVEGLGLGAVVITTDAPPMNELVGDDRGVLVPSVSTEPFRLGHRFKVAPEGVEAAVASLLASPPAERSAKGRAAREWFLANDRRFRSEFPRVIETLLTSSTP
jgi:glycosyltransferase involved in cell wall biosynthesis